MDSMWRNFLIVLFIIVVIKLVVLSTVFGCVENQSTGIMDSEFGCLVRDGYWYTDNGVGHCIVH